MNRSEQTKAGIARSRASGVKWGRYGLVLAKANREMADTLAEELRPIILDLMLNEVEDANGKKIRGHGPAGVAKKLNALGIPTARAGTWHSGTVYRLMKRLEPELSEAFHVARDKLIEQYRRT